MDEYPQTVADPRQWLWFGLRVFPAAGGAYGLGVTLLVGTLAGTLELGSFVFVALGLGLALGAVLGLVCGTVDGALVRYVPFGRLRLATTLANAAITLVVLLLVGFDDLTRGWLYVIAILIGPPVLAGLVTYHHSPEARRIHG